MRGLWLNKSNNVVAHKTKTKRWKRLELLTPPPNVCLFSSFLTRMVQFWTLLHGERSYAKKVQNHWYASLDSFETYYLLLLTSLHLSCCVSPAKPGYELAAVPFSTTLPTLLPDPGAARGGQFESRVYSESLRPPAGAGCSESSVRGPCACHPAVQRRPGSHCWQSVIPGAQSALVATRRVLSVRYPWLCPSSGLELCPSPGLAPQSHPQPAAATVGAAACHRSVSEMSYLWAGRLFFTAEFSYMVPWVYKTLLSSKETERYEQEISNPCIILSSPPYLLCPDSWSEICSSIFRYAAQIPVSRRSQPLLMSRLENLLERVRLKGHRTRTPRSKLTASSWGSIDESACPAFSQIPWDDVLVICIDHKLKDWQIPGPPVCEGEGVLREGCRIRSDAHSLFELTDDVWLAVQFVIFCFFV